MHYELFTIEFSISSYFMQYYFFIHRSSFIVQYPFRYSTLCLFTSTVYQSIEKNAFSRKYLPISDPVCVSKYFKLKSLLSVGLSDLVSVFKLNASIYSIHFIPFTLQLIPPFGFNVTDKSKYRVNNL